MLPQRPPTYVGGFTARGGRLICFEGGSGAFAVAGEVGDLFGCEFVDFESHALEFEFGDVLFDGIGDIVDGEGEFSFFLDDKFAGEGLGGEGHVHDGGGVSFGCGEVDESALGEDVDAFAVGNLVLVDAAAYAASDSFGDFFEALDVDFDIEVAAVADDGAVFHFAEVFGSDDVFVAGECDEEVPEGGGVGHGHDEEAIHGGFEGFDVVDFGDDDVCAHATGAHGESFAAPAVSGGDDAFAGEQEVGGTDDAVDGGLSGAVSVVEEVLGGGVVDGDDGEEEFSGLFHGA